jgi:uncharacterized zinc-type alcohol dehydrogenase-like protein
MISSRGYAAMASKGALVPFDFERRDPEPHDVVIEILYCGICHSDIHQVREEWGPSFFPLVPGHEIIGKVVRTGSAVRKFKADDIVGVGVFVDSCRECAECRAGNEHFCLRTPVWTYNAQDPRHGGVTYGGYSNNIVVHEDYVLRIPGGLNLAAAAPLLCAGITTYSPLRHWQVGPGMKVGIVGLGGLGHMALKFSRALGASHIVQFTTSPSKRDDALRLGAHEVVLSRDERAVKAHAGTFDFILDAVSANHDLNTLLGLLKRDGHLVMVGLPAEPLPVGAFSLIAGRKSLAGSMIGGIRETQEMLDFCGTHNIVADIELIPIQKVNEAYERTIRADVKYRFVIDLASLK